MNNTFTLPIELQHATEHLIQSLRATPPFLAYQQAQARLDADAAARTLLERLAVLQAELRRKQTHGQLIPSDLEELRALRAEVLANEIIMTHLNHQQAAINVLKEINQEIGQLLGVDFAVLARQSTC